MNFNSIIKAVESIVSQIYSSCKGKYPSSHDFLHVKRVLVYSLKIADSINLSEYEKFLLTLACLLHDISIPMHGVKDDHTIKSADYAKQILVNLGLSSEDIEVICNVINEHSWSRNLKPSNRISMVLQDADRLDAIGIIGLVRMVIYGEFNGRTLYSEFEFIPKSRCIDDSTYTIDHVFSKLVWIPASMNFDFTRKLAEERLKYLLWAIETIEFEVNGYM